MSIPDRTSLDPELPEQHLLRGGDRLQDYASAFLRGEITAVQYSDMAFAEINRRVPIDPLLPRVEAIDLPTSAFPNSAVPRIHEDPPLVPAIARTTTHQSESTDRSIVLAQAFVGGQLRGIDFLRLIRDC